MNMLNVTTNKRAITLVNAHVSGLTSINGIMNPQRDNVTCRAQIIRRLNSLAETYCAKVRSVRQTSVQAM
jgi:uncharacterized protein YaaN involved in tellurite resistance